MTSPEADGVAVVIAGGAARRYGTDKLDAEVDGLALIDRTVSGLRVGRIVIIVGPERDLSRPARFVADDHPDGGPAAAMITGLRAALEGPAELIMVLPGDAPGAGAAAESMAAELARRRDAPGLLAVDRSGGEQPLQLALRRPAAEQLVREAGPDGAAGRSARRLVATLDLPRQELGRTGTWDIDTARQHRAWALRDGAEVKAVRRLVAERAPAGLILVGKDGAAVDALADAIELARDDRPTEDAATVAGWATRALPVPSPHRTAAVRIGIGPGPVPDDVDLRLTEIVP